MTNPVMHVYKDHARIAVHPPTSMQRVNADQSADVFTFTYNTDGTVTEQLLAHYNPGEWHAIGNIVCGYINDDPKCARCHPPKNVVVPNDNRPPPHAPADSVQHASVIHLKEQNPQLNNS